MFPRLAGQEIRGSFQPQADLPRDRARQTAGKGADLERQAGKEPADGAAKPRVILTQGRLARQGHEYVYSIVYSLQLLLNPELFADCLSDHNQDNEQREY